jgi:hypothetical protein
MSSFNFNQHNQNSQNSQNNTQNNPDNIQYDPQLKNDVRFQLMQGEKILPADRDDLNDRISELRLNNNIHSNQNQYYRPFNSQLIGLESSLNRGKTGKKNEFKDSINNRLSNCHNSHLLQSQPSQPINQNNDINNSHDNDFNTISHTNDRIFNNNKYQTNKVSNRDKNNNRLSQFIPLGNNSKFPVNKITPINKTNNERFGVSSNSFFDNDGNLQNQYTKNTNENTINYQHNNNMNNNMTNNNMTNNNIVNNHHNQQSNQNIKLDNNVMTIGRLPETNQTSRVNFRDKSNQRLQNLISLPKTSSLPVVPTYQPVHKDLWNNTKENIIDMKKRINELHQNCPVVVNNMMPVDTRQIEYD